MTMKKDMCDMEINNTKKIANIQIVQTRLLEMCLETQCWSHRKIARFQCTLSEFVKSPCANHNVEKRQIPTFGTQKVDNNYVNP